MAKDIRYTATLDPGGFLRGASGLMGSLQQIDTRAKGMLSSVQGSIDGVVGRFGGWGTVLTGLAGSLGALSFTRMIKGAIDTATGLQDLREQSGLTIGTLNTMREAAALSGTPLEAVSSIAVKLAQNLSSATQESAGTAQGLRALGINVDEFRRLGADERMTLLAKRLAEVEDGADKSAVAVAILGKRGAEMLPFMADLAEAGATQANITAEQVAQADELDKNFRRLRVAGSAWKQELAMGMVPALRDVSRVVLDVFNGTGGLRDQIRALAADGSIDRWTRGAVTGLTYVLDGVQYLVRGFRAGGEIIGNVVARLATEIGALGDAAGRALRGDFAGAGQALADGLRASRNMAGELRAELRGIFSEQTLGSQIRDRMAGIAGTPDSPNTPRRALAPFNARAPESGGGKADRQGRMPEWEAALAERKLALAEMANAEGSFREMSKAEEAAYWQAILARTDLTARELVAVRRKAAQAGLEVRKEQFDAEMETLRAERDALGQNYAERVAIATEAHRKIAAAFGEQSKEARKAYADILAEQRKHIEQQRTLDVMAADARRALHLAGIDLERARLQEQLALGVATREQVIAAERALEERIHQIRLQGLQQRLALIDPARDPVAYAQASAQIQQLELQHQERMAQIAQQMRAQTLAPVTDTLRQVESGWGSLIAGFMKGTVTLGGLVRGIFKSAADAVLDTLAKMAAQWMVRQIAMKLFAKTSAAGDIVREAGKAGAGGVASMAAAPFPLNLGAPAFGAAMAATAMSFAPLASARGGFDIPFGINPVTQLHAQEMVLPREQADVIRALARGAAPAAVPVQQNYQNVQNFNFHGKPERRTQQQIGQAAYEAGQAAWQRRI